MRRCAYLIGLLLSAGFAIAGPARSVGGAFDCVTRNRAGDCAIGENQLSLALAASGPAAVRFEFANTGTEAAIVSAIYFDDDGLLAGLSVVTSTPGVLFEPGASPGNLPGGRELDPVFETGTGLAAQALRPSPANGLGPGELLVLELALLPGIDLQDVLAQLVSGELRVGLHVIGFDSRGSESFVSQPVPEPQSGALLGGGLASLALRARWRAGGRDRGTYIAIDM